MHYYKFHISDWSLATNHLSLEEEAVYFRLLNYYYDTECPIPLETQTVSRRLRLGNHSETLELILNEFFEETDDGWINKRCDVEIEEYQKKVEHNKKVGKLGGRPKKNNDLQDNPEITQGVSTINPDVTLTINHKPLTINHKQIKDMSESQEAFERFYSAYPKKIDRKGAEKSWKKIKPEMYEIIIADVINRSNNHEGWTEKKYINAPAVYLNNERWNDEIWLKKIPTQQINKSQQKFTNNTNTALSVFNKLTGVDYEQTRSSNFLENIDIDSRDL